MMTLPRMAWTALTMMTGRSPRKVPPSMATSSPPCTSLHGEAGRWGALCLVVFMLRTPWRLCRDGNPIGDGSGLGQAEAVENQLQEVRDGRDAAAVREAAAADRGQFPLRHVGPYLC